MEKLTFTAYTGKPVSDEEYQIYMRNSKGHKLSFDTTPKGNVEVTIEHNGNLTVIVIPENALRWAFATLEDTLNDGDLEFGYGFHRVR